MWVATPDGVAKAFRGGRVAFPDTDIQGAIQSFLINPVPQIGAADMRVVIQFSTTYLWEQEFSALTAIKPSSATGRGHASVFEHWSPILPALWKTSSNTTSLNDWILKCDFLSFSSSTSTLRAIKIWAKSLWGRRHLLVVVIGSRPKKFGKRWYNVTNVIMIKNIVRSNGKVLMSWKTTERRIAQGVENYVRCLLVSPRRWNICKISL